MQDENIMKMAKQAIPPLMDSYQVSILICCFLHQIHRPIQPKQLYHIAVEHGIVSYFFYQESLAHLLENGSLRRELTEDGEEHLLLTQQGLSYAVELKPYVSKTYLDKLLSIATQYFSRRKREEEVKVSYLPLKKGYYVHVRMLDVQNDLLDMKLYAPDLKQARFLGEQILRNPAAFYGKLLEAAFTNAEE